MPSVPSDARTPDGHVPNPVRLHRARRRDGRGPPRTDTPASAPARDDRWHRPDRLGLEVWSNAVEGTGGDPVGRSRPVHNQPSCPSVHLASDTGFSRVTVPRLDRALARSAKERGAPGRPGFSAPSRARGVPAPRLPESCGRSIPGLPCGVGRGGIRLPVRGVIPERDAWRATSTTARRAWTIDDYRVLPVINGGLISVEPAPAVDPGLTDHRRCHHTNADSWCPTYRGR